MDWPRVPKSKGVRLIVPRVVDGIHNGVFAAGAVWTANAAVGTPFTLDYEGQVNSIDVLISTQNGNCDVGIYDESGTRLRAKGATVMGAAGVQSFDFTDLRLGPGRYYAFFASDSATAVIFEASSIFGGTANGNIIVGVKQVAASYPLPATLVYANPARLTMPAMALILAATP